jgi:hypothetical protein
MKVTPRIRRRGSAIGLRRRPFPSSAHGSSPSFPRRSCVRPESSPPAAPVTRQVSTMLISLRQTWLPCLFQAYGVWHPFDSSSQRQSYLGNGRKIHHAKADGVVLRITERRGTWRSQPRNHQRGHHTDCGDYGLEPVLLAEPPPGLQDQRNDRRADAIADCCQLR